ncbi:MAG: hypothetical protein V4736_04145, partial [Bdellovibrionota bacterium]
MKRFLILITLFLSVAQLSPADERGEGVFTDESITGLPSATVFRISSGDLKVVGAKLGPDHGKPVILIPGLSANFLYLIPLAEILVESGHQVFVYNPPGQGHGILKSKSASSMLGM